MKKFDVVMPTLNSVSRIGEQIFRKVLQQIYTQIPLNRLLVIDDGSDDGTLDVLREFDATIVNGLGSLGKAREIGIKKAETEWFYFIDDDNLIPPNFHEKMWKHVNEKVGMVFPQAIPYNSPVTRYECMVMKFRRSFGLRDTVENRGYTGATLIRRDAVKGIRIPNLARQEDHYIKTYCQKRWKVVYAPEVIVWHFSHGLPSYKTQYLEGYGMAIVRAVSRKRLLAAWLLTHIKLLLTFPYVRDIKAVSTIAKAYYIKYKGYVDYASKKASINLRTDI